MTPTPQILLHSDLHLETGPFSMGKLDVPAIAVFAGDTHHGPVGMPALKSVTDLPVVAVAGNHDFWGSDYFEALAKLKADAATMGVHFLENQVAVVEGVRFMGATLWTDYAGGHPALMHYGLWRMNDHRQIMAARWWTAANKARFLKTFGQHALEHFEGCFNPLLARDLHLKTMRWLDKALATPFDGPTVIVTHHAPAYESLLRAGVVSEEALCRDYWSVRRSDALNLTQLGSYASNALERLQHSLRAANVALWAHGHIHYALNYAQYGVRVAANPRGRVHPPLSKASSLAFSLYGYPVSDEDIEASQRRHAEDPELGDGYGYSRERVIDLTASGYDCIQSQQKQTLATLDTLLEEAATLLPVAKSRRQAVADLAAYRVDTLKSQAIAATRAFAEDMSRQLVAYPTRLPSLDSLLSQCKLTKNNRLASVENIAGYDWVVKSRQRAIDDPFWAEHFGAIRHSATRHLKSRIQEIKEMRACVARAEDACEELRRPLEYSPARTRKKHVANLPEW